MFTKCTHSNGDHNKKAPTWEAVNDLFPFKNEITIPPSPVARRRLPPPFTQGRLWVVALGYLIELTILKKIRSLYAKALQKKAPLCKGSCQSID